MTPDQHIFNLNLDELKNQFASSNLQSWRAGQVVKWLYHHRVQHWDQMTNLSKSLREDLSRQYVLYRAECVKVHQSPDNTRKLLLKWPDGAFTETVLMFEANRVTVCVSTQIGCPVGCIFCASGQRGFQRSLTAGEIVEQVMHACACLEPQQRISHIVLMGMGEPFLNYNASLRAMRIFNASWALNIAARHITVSTVGLPDQIRAFAAEPEQFTLAVSLHAPSDQLRARIIPWARKYPLDDIFTAIDDYYIQTHREVTIEYVLLADINADLTHAHQLARRIGNSRCNVNAINYNAIADGPCRPVSSDHAREFIEVLRDEGVNAHLRKSKGRQIEAACGQLRRTVMDSNQATIQND